MNLKQNPVLFEDYFVLLSSLNEILTEEQKQSHTNLQMRGCAFSNQYAVIGFSLTPEGALADMDAGICSAYSNGSLDGCWVINGTPKVFSVLGLDTATTTFCCDGTGSGAVGCW